MSCKEITERLIFKNYFTNRLAGRPGPLPGAQPPTCILYRELASNTKPEFSIVMPIYNQGPIIEKHLNAILQYTTGSYELILIVDGCSDNTEQVVTTWAAAVTVGPIAITIIKAVTPLFETACRQYRLRVSTWQILFGDSGRYGDGTGGI